MSKVASEMDTTLEPDTLPEIEYITAEEGVKLFDELAHEYLGISGDEFIRRYRAGKIDDLCDPDVAMLVIITPFAEP